MSNKLVRTSGRKGIRDQQFLSQNLTYDESGRTSYAKRKLRESSGVTNSINHWQVNDAM